MKLTGTDPVVGRERVGRLSLLMRCYGDLGIPRVVLSVACRHASAGCCPLRVGHGHGWNQNLRVGQCFIKNQAAVLWMIPTCKQ